MCRFSVVYGFGTLYTNSSDGCMSGDSRVISRRLTDAPSEVIPKTYI